MPELPDIELYVKRIAERVVGRQLVRIAVWSPFALRTYSPAVDAFSGLTVNQVSRLGKRIVLECSGEHFLMIHLMIAGRFQWSDGPEELSRPKSKDVLLSLQFDSGNLNLVERSKKKRASLHLYSSREDLFTQDRRGINIFEATESEFVKKVKEENRTLKRALTDPTKFDGIGNAYSDEILFHARLSPVKLTSSLSDLEIMRLRMACRSTLEIWRTKLLEEISGFPQPRQITAFRPDFATHGKFGQPCPECGNPIQRIVYAENETNYCARCQNEGRLLADRGLSRLLRSDWPKTLEELLGE
ncbi:MAG: formamidopyrimidine-DNA glycosylase [Armatimonadetes bacterium]|nr:formamidopyrimidine-DNA glycosylase [Armatimonadota bacterium]